MMTVLKKNIIKMGNASTLRKLTYEEFIESYKLYKAEKAKLAAESSN